MREVQNPKGLHAVQVQGETVRDKHLRTFEFLLNEHNQSESFSMEPLKPQTLLTVYGLLKTAGVKSPVADCKLQSGKVYD